MYFDKKPETTDINENKSIIARIFIKKAKDKFSTKFEIWLFDCYDVSMCSFFKIQKNSGAIALKFNKFASLHDFLKKIQYI
ncbi:hypothetical protein BpHYR1_032703 [Brachionus plicatilis]|uniref:Uncharacterized protein n=1 Tax=Brachionus plicatilis TaxID=10195 RepID=A0A3M7Q4M0_BRAPC|nr:hypothetical protein BpHYR1_032703 [Brachionus plicatilis]